MRKVRIKDLIEFRNKSDRSKKTYARSLKTTKKIDSSSGGGDYWISCLSAISNTFKYGKTDFLDEKIELLMNKIDDNDDSRIKLQFKRNADILVDFKSYDFNRIRPKAGLTFLKKPSDKSVIEVKGLTLKSTPHHIFSFSRKGSDEMGAVWFIAKLDGFKKNELGMFSDILYRSLGKHYSKDYFINSEYCIAVDVVNKMNVSYKEIENGKVPILIDATIDEINGL